LLLDLMMNKLHLWRCISDLWKSLSKCELTLKIEAMVVTKG
jgi:hypothetical protein